MINVQINQEDCRTQVLVQGHSGYAPIGSDIVCAGVSALTQAYVLQMDASDIERCIVEDGLIDIITVDSRDNELRLSYLKCGLDCIQDNYSKHISIEKNKKII